MLDLEQAVLNLINEDEVVALTAELVAIPTSFGREDAGQNAVENMLKTGGAQVESWSTDISQLSQDPWFSAEIDRQSALTVVGSIGGDSGPTLLIDGHIDVVPEGDPHLWASSAFEPEVRDGRLYGRGACDMKGGLAAAIHALSAVNTVAGTELAGRALVASVFGEEDGGSGTLALLHHGIRPDACIIAEPTQLTVAPATAGALSFRVRVSGKAAHGALREEGVSAIERLPFVHRALLDLEAERNTRLRDPLYEHLRTPFAICAGRVEGGDWPSSEADWLILEGRYGVAPGEDLMEARTEFENAIQKAASADPWLREHPPVVEWWGGQFYPARTSLDDPILTTLSSAITSETDKPPVVRGVPYGSDMGLTVGMAAIPTLVFGPGDPRDAHRPNESTPVSELVACARILALTMLRFCGVRS